MAKPKPVNKKMWGYFSPSGWLQTRSLADTKKESREQIVRQDGSEKWQDYDNLGFVLKKLKVEISIID